MSNRDMPSAVLIVNPNAGRVPVVRRDETIGAVREHFSLEVLSTTGRNTGQALARDAAAAGTDLVIAYGGDGVVNEVVNGLAGSSCALGILPGGTMNVFARALGIPVEPAAAIEHLRASMERAPRVVSLGVMDERFFTFSAGCGFDAEAAARVELHTAQKRRLGPLYFFWSAAMVLASTYRHRNPSMTLRGGTEEVEVAMAVACKAGPYAYLGGRPIDLAPEVELDGDLDVFALRKMRIEALPFYALRVVTDRITGHRDAIYEHGLEKFEITAEEPFARHVDGEPLEAATSASFSVARDVLRVHA